MTNQERTRYAELLQERFPGIVVTPAPADGPEDITTLDVFFVPDNEVAHCRAFFRSTVRPKAMSEGLPWALLMPHSVSATREHYPSVSKTVSGGRQSVEGARKGTKKRPSTPSKSPANTTRR